MADRNVVNTATLDTLRTTYNSTAADVGDIASVTGASGVIGAATDIVEAITLMNTEVTAIKDGTAVFETKITFEGATDDAYETILAITDPTADRTITFPDRKIRRYSNSAPCRCSGSYGRNQYSSRRA